MQHSANPLIKENKADTIDQICDYLDHLIRREMGSRGAEPGTVVELLLLKGAANSLKD